MFQTLLAAGLLLAAADPASTSARPSTEKPPAAAAAPPAKPRQVCRETAVLGTRLTKTVCTSRAEIDDRVSRDRLDQLQPNRAR